jgi:hypothetical protein
MNSNPPPKWLIVLSIIFLMSLCFVLIIAITTGWPPNKHFFRTGRELNPEQMLIVLVAVGGALGAFIHVATSFTDYIGSNKFEQSWIPWYFMRPFIGAALALAFYFLLRGGLITVNTGSAEIDAQYSVVPTAVNIFKQDTLPGQIIKSTVESIEGFTKIGAEKPNPVPPSVPPINPFGVTAVSLLAGLFSRQAVDKLKEVFENLFMTKEKVDRANPLHDEDNNNDTAGADTGTNEEEPVG